MVVLPIWSFTTVCLQHIRIDYNSLGGWHFLSTVLVLIDTCQLCISLVHGLVKCYTVIPLVPGEHGATLDSDWMVGVTYHIMFVCNVVGFFFEMLKFICTLPLSYIYIYIIWLSYVNIAEKTLCPVALLPSCSLVHRIIYLDTDVIVKGDAWHLRGFIIGKEKNFKRSEIRHLCNRYSLIHIQ